MAIVEFDGFDATGRYVDEAFLPPERKVRGGEGDQIVSCLYADPERWPRRAPPSASPPRRPKRTSRTSSRRPAYPARPS